MRFSLPPVAMILALTLVLAETAFGQAATTAQAKPAARFSAFMDVNFGVVFPAQDAFTSKGSYAPPVLRRNPVVVVRLRCANHGGY